MKMMKKKGQDWGMEGSGLRHVMAVMMEGASNCLKVDYWRMPLLESEPKIILHYCPEFNSAHKQLKSPSSRNML